MRFTGIFFLTLLFGVSPALAQDPQFAVQPGPPLNTRICIVDKTKAVDGQTFQSCDAAPENNALLMKGFMIARIDRGTIKSKQPIWVHNVCRYVDNRSPSQDVLVPFGTEDEWLTFNKLVPGIMKVAGCCVPRTLTVRDIPEPTSPCVGRWTLQQVVSTASLGQGANPAEQIIDEKMKIGGGDAMLSSNGAPLSLPISRDDDNTAFTVDGIKDFSARWMCSNDEPTAATPTPVAEGDENPASNGDVLYVSFTVNCTHEQWTPVTLQNFCVPYENNRAYPCEMMGYPAGTAGDVIMYEKTMCPKGTTTRSLIKDSCEGQKINEPAAEVTPTEPAADAAPAAAPAPDAAAASAKPPNKTNPKANTMQ
ncbi:MAG: hypothetical protein SFW65_08255 [Alphaproteobacteria bacterium]|nr:hypothetical protein [Alphaproteobacteria bacterium]